MQAVLIKNSALFICICMTMSCCSTPEALNEPLYAKAKQIALAPPIIKSEQMFFEKENPVVLALGLEGVNIHYTLDGSEPTESAPLYADTILIQQSGIIKAKAFHPQFSPSETATAQFIRLGPKRPVKSIVLNRPPHDNYPGNGPEGLLDRAKGSTNFRTAHWMGFDGGKVEAIIAFEKEEYIHKITASVLSDQASWIFPPKSMIVYGSQDGKEYTKLSILNLSLTPEGAPNALKFITTDFPQTSIHFVKVVLQHFEGIPQWHPGKGTAPWLFIDEILIE